MDFSKSALDKYITASPNDEFISWCEMTVECFSDDFSQKNWLWIDDSKLCNDWFNKLFKKEYDEETAAKIVERAFTLYKQ